MEREQSVGSDENVMRFFNSHDLAPTSPTIYSCPMRVLQRVRGVVPVKYPHSSLLEPQSKPGRFKDQGRQAKILTHGEMKQTREHVNVHVHDGGGGGGGSLLQEMRAVAGGGDRQSC